MRFLWWRSKIEIYTDGSYKQGLGSWAYVIVKNGVMVHEASGRVQKTSSHRMEFQAAIEALKSLSPKTKAILYSDSKILVQTVNIWMQVWHRNQWCKKKNSPIANLDQIQALHQLQQNHQISWQWIKAHSGIHFNERCDELCFLARTKSREKSQLFVNLNSKSIS